MAEKRKPCYVILLTKIGKESQRRTAKVEFYRRDLWGSKKPGGRSDPANMYRLRVNGKWFNTPKGDRQYFYKTEIMRLLANSIKLK